MCVVQIISVFCIYVISVCAMFYSVYSDVCCNVLYLCVIKCEVLRVLSLPDSVYLWLAQIAPITHFDFVPIQGQCNKADLLL